MFEAKVIAHSAHQGKEIVTFQLVYPRWVHGEVMTHRVFSRNAMSSRAVPAAKMIEQVRTNPAKPIRWGLNQSGMQAAEQSLEGAALEKANEIWERMANACAEGAAELAELGLHKQWANRPLEPFQWMRTIVSATEWDNFYALRCHPDAQPEFQHLAGMMRVAHEASTPEYLQVGQWHLPYVLEHEKTLPLKDLRKVSAARCARVSYLTHDGQDPSIGADLALFDRLAAGKPIHASPLEHQATPYGLGSGNFKGWTQFRYLWENQQVAA